MAVFDLLKQLHLTSVSFDCTASRISAVFHKMMLAVPLVGCVCSRILTSSFHDWLEFMDEMMKGAAVHTISDIRHSSQTLPWRPPASPNLSDIRSH